MISWKEGAPGSISRAFRFGFALGFGVAIAEGESAVGTARTSLSLASF